jgi:predicted aminopeptidase
VPQLKTGFRHYADEPLNNARLIGTRLYYEHLDLFQQVFDHYNGSLRASVTAIISAAKRKPDSPFVAVQGILR